MTATTTAGEFAEQLRTLANLYDASPDLPVHAYPLRISAAPSGARDGFLALRRLFPDADFSEDARFVDVQVTVAGLRVRFAFWKADIGVKQTVTREVTEYVLPDVAVAS